jgi:hypothetical protein
MRSFEINGVSVLVAYNWHVSDVINARSIFDGTIVDKLSFSAIETGQEIKVYTEELSGNARDLGSGTFSRTSNATMQNGTVVTANATRYETGQFGQAVMVEEGTTNQLPLANDWTSYALKTAGIIITSDDITYAPYSIPADKIVMDSASNYIYKTKTGLSAITGQTWTFSAKVYAAAPISIFIALTDHATWAEGWIEKINLVTGWNSIKVTRTFGTTVQTSIDCIFANFDFSTGGAAGGSGKGAASSGAITFWVLYSQLEQKAYATSWIQGGTTRIAETLTIPTSNIWNRGNWTVEMVFIPTNAMNAGEYKDFWTNIITDGINAYYLGVSPTGQLIAYIYSGGTSYNILSITELISLGGTYNIALSGDGSIMRLYCNGVQIGFAAYIEPVGIFQTNMCIGSNYGTEYANGLIDDMRISNIARDSAEILASYNTGAALPIDAHTTAKMAFDGTLEIFARPVIFAGTIDAPEEIETDPGYLYYPITAVDYNQIADKRLYAASHENMLAGNIVSAIISAKLSEEGVTAGSIENGPMISKANFNYKKCSESLDYLKDVTGMNWNIDFNKKLNFFSNSTNLAPWILNDTVQHTNFRVKRNRSQYRNRQYVRAGTGKTTTQTLEKPSPKPDGSSRSFVLRFPIAERPVIYINSTAVLSANVGVNGLDTGKSWYFSYDSNIISQESGTAVLTSGTTLEITYTGLYPIVAFIDDPAQIAARAAVETGTSGIYENLQTEKSINERNQAIEYTQGLISRYGIIPTTITFDTEVPGLRAGQLLPIQKSLFGINASYLIESVDISAADAGKINYSVRCLDGSALGGWETFFRDLLKAGQEYIIQENEVIVLLNLQTEKENWGSELGIFVLNTNLYLNIENFSFVDEDIIGLDIISFCWAGGGMLIIGCGGLSKLHRSFDYGTTWDYLTRLGTELNVYSIINLGNGILIAGTGGSGNIYKSIDHGGTWTFKQNIGTSASVQSLVDLGSGIVIAGTGISQGKIYKSTDSGESFSLIQQLSAEATVYSLCYLGGSTVIAGTGDSGKIFKSTNLGNSWTYKADLGSEEWIWSLCYLGSGIVLAGTGPTGRIYKSTDSGDTWNLIQRLGSETNIRSLDYINGTVLAGTSPNGQVYKSTDLGATWSLIQRLGSASSVYTISHNHGTIICGTNAGGLYRISTVTEEVLYD